MTDFPTLLAAEIGNRYTITVPLTGDDLSFGRVLGEDQSYHRPAFVDDGLECVTCRCSTILLDSGYFRTRRRYRSRILIWHGPTLKHWTTGELVTAAKLNTNIRDNLGFLAGWEGDFENQDVTGFTNTAYADLDALTAAPFSNAVSVSVVTGTEALVIVSVVRITQVTSGTCFLSYRVSGATTLAADDDFGLRCSIITSVQSMSVIQVRTGLTAGTNVFELQARVTANSANMSNPSIVVIPKP